MAKLSTLLQKGFHPETGLFKMLAQVPLQPAEPPLFIAACEFQDPLSIAPRNGFTHERLSPFMLQGCGAAFDQEAAVWSAVGEACERYSAFVYEPASLEVAPLCSLGPNSLDPSNLILFSSEQYASENFPYRRFDPSIPIAWVRGYNLTKKTPAFVPACITYMSYHHISENELLDATYSTGLAAGGSYAQAVNTGLREVIERDSFSSNWLLGRTPPRLDPTGILPAMPQNLKNLFNLPNIDVNIRDLKTDLDVPCFISLLRPFHKKGISTGAAAHLNPMVALEKGVVESFHTLNWTMDMARWQNEAMQEGEIQDFDDHVRYYLNPRNFHDIAFMFADAPNSAENFKKFPLEEACDDSKSLRYLIDQLAAKGYDVFVVDITPDDIADLGIVVTKVFVPGLQPMYSGRGREHQDRRRLARVAKHYGIEVPAVLNTRPHSFP